MEHTIDWARVHEDARFWKKVDFGSGADACWIWQGTVTASGYGQYWAHTKRGTRPVPAHRYVMGVHDSLRGPLIRHKCDVRTCVNPSHLEPGTQDDNMNDRAQRGHTIKRLRELGYTVIPPK